MDPSRIGAVASGVLCAYEPEILGVELYTSDQAGAIESTDYAAKFAIPLVVNGKIFAAGETQLTVYRLLP